MATVLFFGRLSDVSEALNVDLPAFVTTTGELMVWLEAQNAGLKTALERGGNRIAVNKVIIENDVVITNTDEIAFMSPLSGG